MTNLITEQTQGYGKRKFCVRSFSMTNFKGVLNELIKLTVHNFWLKYLNKINLLDFVRFSVIKDAFLKSFVL